MLGHVNHARYLTYLEEGRIQYAFDVLQWSGEGTELGMIVVKVVFDYLMPLHVKETIEVHTRCSRIGRKSFDLSYVVVRDGNLVGNGTTSMVAFDYEAATSRLITDAWRDKILAYETVAPEQG